MILVTCFMDSFQHHAAFSTGYWCYDRHRSFRLVVCDVCRYQIAQSVLSSLKVIYYSAQLFRRSVLYLIAILQKYVHVFQCGIIIAVFTTTSLTTNAETFLRYLYSDDDAHEIIAFFNDGTFAFCQNCGSDTKDTFHRLFSTSFIERDSYKITMNNICIAKDIYLPLPQGRQPPDK